MHWGPRTLWAVAQRGPHLAVQAHPAQALSAGAAGLENEHFRLNPAFEKRPRGREVVSFLTRRLTVPFCVAAQEMGVYSKAIAK